MSRLDKWKNGFFITISVLFCILLVNHSWWWLGSFSEFKNWYSNFGSILWFLKIICLIGWVFFTTKIIWNNYGKYAVFIVYVLLALVLKNQHPFSNLAVYDTFPKQSFLFYIEDQNGRKFNHGINYKSADLIDIYDTYLKRKSGSLDEKQLKEIAKNILQIAKNKSHFNGNNCFKVIRVTNSIEQNNLTSSKQILYDECH